MQQDVVSHQEWWERVAARRDRWLAGHPQFTRVLGRVAAVAVWGALGYLLVLLIVWPTARWSARVWLGVLWLVLCWFFFARTKTVSWTTTVRCFGLGIAWAGVIAWISWLVATVLAGQDSVSSTASVVVVASVVEETLKVFPLVVLAIVAPGRVRRWAVVDWAVLGFVFGAGFEALEEGIRRVGLFELDPGLLDLCGWYDGARKMECYGVSTFGLSPFGGGFTGVAPYAGHAFLTALVAVAIGLGVRCARSRSLQRRWRWPVALGLPLATAWVAVVDHMARNGSSETQRWAEVEDAMSAVVEWSYLLSGAGHGRPLVLLLLVASGMILDARVHSRHGLADPVTDRQPGPIEAVFTTAREQLDRLGGRVRQVGLDLLAVGYLVVRDIADWCSLLIVDVPGVSAWERSLTRRRLLSALAARQRQEREREQRDEWDADGTRSRTRWIGLAGVWLCALLVLLIAPWGTTVLAEAMGEAPSLFGWLAGILDGMSQWWSDLPWWGKTALIVGAGALVVASGGSLGLAMGVGGTAWTTLDGADELAGLARDPAGTARRYARHHTPAEMAVDAAWLGLSFAGEGAVAAIGGKAARSMTGAAHRSGLVNSLRDHLGELPGALVTPSPDVGMHAYSGVPVGKMTSVPEWLARVRAGARWHRGEQGTLDLEPGGYSEVHVAKPEKADGTVPKGWNRVDHFNDEVERIYSMKHTQLADIKEGTAVKYLDELLTKYKPGTPIGEVPSTPSDLVGKSLKGQQYLYVPVQEADVPARILDYAKAHKIQIVDPTGRHY